jgi:hypothetical protein
MASAWNLFVKKIYWENKKKNKNFQFKEALKEASRRKGEMGTSSSMKTSKKSSKNKKGGRKGKSRKMRGGTGNKGSMGIGSDAVQLRAGNAN